MTNIRELRLYSNFLYILRDKKSRTNIGATNLTVLAKKSGISYGKLRYTFHIQDQNKYETDDYIILRVSTAMIFKTAHKGGGKTFKKD